MALKLGLHPDEMHQLHEQLAEPSALEAAGATPTVQRLLQAIHADTWFRLGDQPDVVRTSLGSRPGDSFADVIFGFLWARLLRSYVEALDAHNVLEQIPICDMPDITPIEATSADHHPFLGPNWMDDLNVCIASSTNAGIERKAGVALSILLDKCKELFMVPNLGSGKTEVMFTFRGEASRAFRRKYFAQASCMPIVGEHGLSQVAVVSRYLHLGGMLHHRAIDRVEVTRRLAIAHQAFTSHRRVLFHNKCIAWEKRKDMFVTLILSKLAYGLESWTLNSQRQKDQFYGGVMKLYRRLLKLPHDCHISDLELLVKVGLPKPDELLRQCRLRYFGTLHNCGTSAQWGLLQEDHAWMQLLKDDLSWLWNQIENTSSIGDPFEHYPAWKDLLIHHGGYWKKLIKRGIAHAAAQRENYWVALGMHQRVGTILLQHEWVSQLPSGAKSTDPEEHFGCMKCQTRHLSHGGESAHMFKSHGVVAQARHLFA